MTGGNLVSVTDSTGRADVEFARRTWKGIAEAYAALRLPIKLPVALVIEKMPIMGATESTKDGHRLHVASHAVAGGMLDGLMAHEAGHMVRIERRHPSHLPEVYGRILDEISIPAARRQGFASVAREAINHVEDIYADDLAIRVLGQERDLAPFFSDWIRNSARPAPSRWATVGNAVTIAFALGNMARHGVRPEDGVAGLAEAFSRNADVPSVESFAASFRDLPDSDDPAVVGSAMDKLLRGVASEGLRSAR
ncbi:MAG: hypothetical protein E6K18_06205 [Methanobacteriota archaeon]|nr:MAG: hypothetical protein E6K18_06205 [Euryarchaeota archaeon]